MINQDIFEKAITQFQDTVKGTTDSDINQVDALNNVLNIDSESLVLITRTICEDLREIYPEDLQTPAAVTYGMQIGILAGRQEAIENTSSS